MRTVAVAGVIRLLREEAEKEDIECERLLREEAEKEDMEFERAMTYGCQMMQRRISTTEKENAIVEEKVVTTQVSMTNRIMLTEVMVAGEKRMSTQPQQPSQNSNGQKAEGQAMAGNNVDFHKSRDVITRLVSNDKL